MSRIVDARTPPSSGFCWSSRKSLEQGEGVAAEHAAVDHLDLPVADLEPPVEAPHPRPSLPVEEALAEELQQQLVQPAEVLDGPVVAFHELLDAEVVVGVAIPEVGRDRDLAIEEQAVLAPAGEVVERGARLPQKVLAVAKAPELLPGQEAVVEEVAKPRTRPPFRPEVAARDPRDGLDVAEPARPLPSRSARGGRPSRGGASAVRAARAPWRGRTCRRATSARARPRPASRRTARATRRDGGTRRGS